MEDILHVMHDNHPHVPHVSSPLTPPLSLICTAPCLSCYFQNISDGYFAKRARSRSPAAASRRLADSSAPYSHQPRHPSLHDSDAMSEPGYYKSTGASRARTTLSDAPRRAGGEREKERDRGHVHRRSAERTPTSAFRRSLAEHSPNDEKVNVSVVCGHIGCISANSGFAACAE